MPKFIKIENLKIESSFFYLNFLLVLYDLNVVIYTLLVAINVETKTPDLFSRQYFAKT
jgi:hypothetical protein